MEFKLALTPALSPGERARVRASVTSDCMDTAKEKRGIGSLLIALA